MQPLTRIMQTISRTAFMARAEKLGVPRADAEAHYHASKNDEVFKNDTYLVIRRKVPDECNPFGFSEVKWLSIRRLDGQMFREWNDLQSIKNQLLGEEAEAIEIFPAESRKVDEANQYHLWGGGDWKAPFGFPRRMAHEGISGS